MTSCTIPRKATDCGPSDFKSCRTLEQMVDVFLRDQRDEPEQERAWWGDPRLSVQDACRRAMFAFEDEGKRDGHQWVFSKADLQAIGERVAAHAAELETAATFGDLYRRVERALGLGRNCKPLLVYDIARRLGYRLGRDPEEVYLHAGPKIGANALRRGLGRARSRPLRDFPTSIRTRLTLAQAEDFLCLAAKWLRADLWD